MFATNGRNKQEARSKKQEEINIQKKKGKTIDITI